jgi:hypothetical protein
MSQTLRWHPRPSSARPAIDPEKAKPDSVPIIERYQDVAAQLHRTAIAPRTDRYIMACSCGWAELSPVGGSGRASIICQQHVIDAAERLYEKLEGKRVDALEGMNE